MDHARMNEGDSRAPLARSRVDDAKWQYQYGSCEIIIGVCVSQGQFSCSLHVLCHVSHVNYGLDMEKTFTVPLTCLITA